MKLSQVDDQTLTTLFGKEFVEKLSGALKEGDEELSLGARINGRVVTQEQEKSIREEGVQQGKQLGYKEIAKGLEVTLNDGEKDPSIIVEKFKSATIVSLEEKYKNPNPSEREKELESKFEQAEQKYNKLNSTYEEKLNTIKEWEEKYNGLQKENRDKELNNIILSSLPEKLKIDKQDALLIARNSLQFEQSDDGFIIKKDGVILTDNIGNPEKIENVIKSFAENKKWIGGKPGIDDGGDGGGGGLPKGMTNDEAIAYITKQKLDPMSDKGLEMFSQLTKQ